METTIARPTFAALLESAVTQPGSIARAYSAFHGFSLGNQLLAAQQCGERALWLWMPLTMRRPVTRDDGTGDTETFTRFALKPHWFVYAQTEGREMLAPVIPEWDRGRALAALDVTETPFDLPDGNTLG